MSSEYVYHRGQIQAEPVMDLVFYKSTTELKYELSF